MFDPAQFRAGLYSLAGSAGDELPECCFNCVYLIADEAAVCLCDSFYYFCAYSWPDKLTRTVPPCLSSAMRGGTPYGNSGPPHRSWKGSETAADIKGAAASVRGGPSAGAAGPLPMRTPGPGGALTTWPRTPSVLLNKSSKGEKLANGILIKDLRSQARDMLP
jgi:hypothetical protein